MTNTKATKRALLSSVLALFLCFTMLLGTTFAWFTDSVTSANNIIKSGNLDIVLEYWDGDSWEDVKDSSEILAGDHWEPGYTDVAYLRFKNAGSLALKYQLGVNIVSETAGVNVAGEEFKLSDYIYFNVIDDLSVTPDNAPIFDRAAANAVINGAAASAKTIATGYTKAGTLQAGTDYTYLAMVVYMPTSVGNEANHDGTNVPEINLGINIFATQLASESDSFGPDYDFDAPIVNAPIARPDSAVTLKGAEDVMITLPTDVISELPAEVTEISMVVSEPKVDATNNTITFASIELVDQNGDVIDLEALNLTENITVTLPAQTTFQANETVAIYHDGEFVATATVATDGTIVYEVAHLCEVTVTAIEIPVADESGIVKIGTAAELFGFAQNVNTGVDYYEGKTVVLTADIDLNNANWTPVGSASLDHGFMGNFDGNGYKIMNLTITNPALDSDSYAYAGFFGVTEGAADAENVIENLTIENVTIVTDGHIVAAAIAYPYYTTVKNVTVCGDIAIKGGDYTAGALAYTRRCVNASNVAVNGNEGSCITGAITVGGVISDIQMNGGLIANYSNFSASNLTVTGEKSVGGISGIIGPQTLNGATVKNVKLVCDDARVGIVAGSIDGKPVINKVTYENVTGATSIVGAPYNLNSDAIKTVIIDGVEYAGNTAAFKAQLATGTVNLACDITLTETITIANGQSVVINLNGNAINGILSGTGNQDLFLVKGNLTVNNGTVNLTATQNQEWNAMAAIFDITAGGVVTLDGITANVGGTDMNFVAHLNNWGTATLNVDNSTLNATYVAVRVFNSGYDMNNVTIKNSTLSTTGNAAFWVHNYTAADFGTQEKADAQAKLLNFKFDNVTFEANKAAIRYGFTNAEYYAANGATVVSTADELVAALEAGKNVVFANDITVAATSGGYNKAGIVVNKGQVVDGNGYTLTVTGAGGTWDCAIYLTNGTIKNITVAGAMRGVFTAGQSADLYLDTVTFKNVVYTFNSDAGNKDYTIYINNCNMNGWTSHSDVHNAVVYTNCEFGKGSGYAFCRPYGATTFVGCNFADGYEIDAVGKITFDGCTLGGVAVTADNLNTLVIGNAANATVK